MCVFLYEGSYFFFVQFSFCSLIFAVDALSICIYIYIYMMWRKVQEKQYKIPTNTTNTGSNMYELQCAKCDALVYYSFDQCVNIGDHLFA